MRAVAKKRNFTEEHNDNGSAAKQKAPSPPVITKRLQGLLEERKEQNTDT